MNNEKKEWWRIIVAVLAIIWILFRLTESEITGSINDLPREQVWIIILTSIGVTLLKISAIAVVVFLVKWLVTKNNDKNDSDQEKGE